MSERLDALRRKHGLPDPMWSIPSAEGQAFRLRSVEEELVRRGLDCCPPEEDFEDADDLDCTHCGGEGDCDDGSDPLGNCPDNPHRCHACNGSGKRSDQVIF